MIIFDAVYGSLILSLFFYLLLVSAIEIKCSMLNKFCGLIQSHHYTILSAESYRDCEVYKCEWRAQIDSPLCGCMCSQHACIIEFSSLYAPSRNFLENDHPKAESVTIFV